MLALQRAVGNRSVARMMEEWSEPAFAPAVRSAVGAGLAAPAEPLAAVARAALEPRFGRELASVRVHRGAAARDAADALGADAFTVGRDVVLGFTTDEDAALGHEVAHAVQQGLVDAHGEVPSRIAQPSGPEEQDAAAAERGGVPSVATGPQVARQAGSSSGSVPTTKTWADLWKDFEGARFGPADPQAAALARQLATQIGSATLDEKIQHGPDLVAWLLRQGMRAEASAILRDVESAWMIRSVTEGGRPLPSLGGFAGTVMGNAVDDLVTQGQALAAAGDHARAIQVLGTAYELYQFQLLEAGPAREQQMASVHQSAEFAEVMRSSLYPGVRHAYDQMRSILGTYLELARRARASGDVQRAAQLSAQSAALRAEIDARFTWSGSLITAEVQNVTNLRGQDALRVYGANDVQIDLTQLPGLPPPREVGGASGRGAFTYQWATPESVTAALGGQVALLEELRETPQIQAAFGDAPIDMNDTTTRLRVWSIMFAAFGQRGGDALPRLMALIGRYLRAFTVHTSYNVPDFGTSYLARNEGTMPSDLAGRLERDCGVYALTVAYEVFRTTRAPALPVDFRIWVFPEHVTLVIRDLRANQFYVVNNDQVSPAAAFDPASPDVAIAPAVANAYAPIRGHRYTVTPAVELPLGDTSLSDAQFRAQAWSRYQLGESWGISSATTYRQSAPGYEAFYAAQADAATTFARIAASMTILSRALQSARSAAEQLAILNTGQAGRPGVAEIRAAIPLARAFFERLGPGAPVVTPSSSTAEQLRQLQAVRYLWSAPAPGEARPLARLAMALLHLQALGGALTQADLDFIAYCRTRFAPAMGAYAPGSAAF